MLIWGLSVLYHIADEIDVFLASFCFPLKKTNESVEYKHMEVHSKDGV